MDRIGDIFSEYFGAALIYLPKYLIAFVIIAIFFVLARQLRKKIIKLLSVKADDKLLVNFIDNIFRIVNILIGLSLFLLITDNSNIAKGILGAAGISAFVIGFAFKDIGENFLAGVILAFNRPFRLGDVIKTADVEGRILEMSLRDTHIKTFDGKDVYIPNGQILKNPLYNYTIDGFLRKQFSVGVGFQSNIDMVRNEIIEELYEIPGILTEKKVPATYISDFGDSAIIIIVQYWINTFDQSHSSTDIHTQAMTKVLNKLQSRGVEIPGNVVEVKNVV